MKKTANIKYVPVKETRTAKCPAKCESEDGASRLLACGKVSYWIKSEILAGIKEFLFKEFVCSNEKSDCRVTVFDIYSGNLMKNMVSANKKYRLFSGRKEFDMNSCTGLYPTRELFNPKSPLVGNRDEILADIQNRYNKVFGKNIEISSSFWNESCCSDIDGMIKGYCSKVSMLTKTTNGTGQDSKWKISVNEACNKTAFKNSADGQVFSRILVKCGPQLNRAVNGFLPDVKKVFGKDNKKTLKTKIDGEAFDITYSVFETNKTQIKRLYMAAAEIFKSKVLENLPKPSEMNSFTITKMRAVYLKNPSYYDAKVILCGIPGGDVAVYVRTHSYKDRGYYPADFFKHTAECPKGTLKFNSMSTNPSDYTCIGIKTGGENTMSLHIPYEIEIMTPIIEKVEKINLNRALGADINSSVAVITTTKIISDNMSADNDIVDWHEAIYAYSKVAAETNLFTKTSQTTRDNLELICKEYEFGRYPYICIPTVGLRDMAPPDEKHNWEPSADPLVKLMAWLMRRTNPDGTPFYTERQLAIIGSTGRYRQTILQMLANREHYFAEQAKWDRSHNPQVHIFTKESAIARELNEKYNMLDDKNSQLRQQLIAYELTNTRFMKEDYDYIALENLNLNDIEKSPKFVSLYTTVTRDWKMSLANRYRVSASRNSDTAVIEFPDKPDRKQINKLCTTTKYWNAPDKISISGNIVTLQCKPTDEGIKTRHREWIDYYLRNSLHLSLLKSDIERIALKKLKVCKTVPAKYTSQVCNVCGHSKFAKKNLRLSPEQAKAKQLNYRYCRSFICGNPDCAKYGIEQNADENAAYNIRNLIKKCK